MSTLFLKKFPKDTFLSAALCSLFLIPNLDAVREGQKQLPQRHDDLMQHMRAQRKKLTQSSKKTDKPPTGLRSYHLSDPTLKQPDRQKRMAHTSEPL